MVKTIHFNTGRAYTNFGQRITATLHDDGVVTFFDHDRAVDGEFKLGQYCSFNDIEVMHWYDSSNCTNTKRSWNDAFTVDGVNSKYED